MTRKREAARLIAGGAFAGRRVLVTGSTGFKGSWLCELLLAAGAQVWGYSLPPPTSPALFSQLGLSRRIRQRIGDVRDFAALARAVRASRPHAVFHLAAQAIVRGAHEHPLEAWSTNVLGTANVLEAVRRQGGACAVVVATTDKVYGADARVHSEGEALLASDPYGASKVGAEIAARCWQGSFFGEASKGPRVAVATARSGNAIGGGDWARDRLVPDAVRAFSKGRTLEIRNPSHVRPWQHVLDPLDGYMRLAAALAASLRTRNRRKAAELASAFNFGPRGSDHYPVSRLADELAGQWPGHWRRSSGPAGPNEGTALRLNSSKARRLLGWEARWRLPEAIERTAAWYRHVQEGAEPRETTLRQIWDYYDGRG